MSGGPKRLGDGGVIDVGAIGGDDRDQQIEVLNLEVRRLQRAVMRMREAERAREDADRALGTLRRQLSPLYRALQAVFGELDAAGVTETAAPGPPTATVHDRARWDEWKQRLGPACARVIDALLLGGEMNVTALTVACKMSKRTVYEAMSKMGRAGLLDHAHGRYSLKV